MSASPSSLASWCCCINRSRAISTCIPATCSLISSSPSLLFPVTANDILPPSPFLTFDGVLLWSTAVPLLKRSSLGPIACRDLVLAPQATTWDGVGSVKGVEDMSGAELGVDSRGSSIDVLSNVCRSRRLRARNRKMDRATRVMPVIPPTTPPAIAPTGAGLCFGVEGGEDPYAELEVCEDEGEDVAVVFDGGSSTSVLFYYQFDFHCVLIKKTYVYTA